MFTTKAFRLVVICLLALVLFTPGAQAQRKKQLAVLNFDFATVDIGLAGHAYGGQENLARAISDKLVNTLVAQNTCVVIERSQLEKVLYEQNLGTQGRIDPSTAAKVGRILGVDAIIIGNVSVFDLQGTPKNSRDTSWDPKQLRARIAVNFRVVDTTTAVVQASSEATGVSGQGAPASAGPQIAKDAIDAFGGLGRIIGNNRVGRAVSGMENRNEATTVTHEQIRNVVQLAVDDVVGQVTIEIEKYLAGSRRAPEKTASTERHLNGSVIDVQGPTVFITGIDRSAVRIGDRLYVRRSRIKRDPVSGKEIRLTDKIGEVEIVEIQDEAVVGSFSGSVTAQEGDIITSNPGGAGATSSDRGARPPSSPTTNTAPSDPSAKPQRAPTRKRP